VLVVCWQATRVNQLSRFITEDLVNRQLTPLTEQFKKASLDLASFSASAL
jgi:hypothetical protein